MARRALPALLALIAFVADLSGSHGVALALVLGSIPPAFALEARCGGFRPLSAAGGLGLLVLSAALRSPAVVGGVPHLAVSAVVLALLLYLGAFVGALLASPRPARLVLEEEPERLAA